MASNAQGKIRSSRNPGQKGGPNRRNNSQPRTGTTNVGGRYNSIPNSDGIIPPLMSMAPSNSEKCELTRDMECPVCTTVMRAPIYMCETGHSLCQQCTLRMTPPVCPLCRFKITLQRNFTLENIASKIPLPCLNSQFGCKFRLTESNQAAHYEQCNYRQTFCPIGRITSNPCAWNGNFEKIFEHMKQSHPDNIKLKLGQEVIFPEFSVTKPDEDVQVIKMGPTILLYHVKIDTKFKVAYWLVQFMGSKNDANNWKYQFDIFKKNEPMKKIEISEQCTADSENVQDIYKSGKCVAVPLHMLKNYINSDRSLTFKFYAFFINPNKKDGKMDMNSVKQALPQGKN